MKKIRNILFALPLALTLIACSDDDIATTPASTNPLDELGAVTGTLVNVEEFKAGEGDVDPLVSKSQFYYDRVNGKLKFTWVENDKIGIFPNDIEGDQFPFVIDWAAGLQTTDSYVTGIFNPVDEEAAYPIMVTQKYFSYFPYKAGTFHYDAVPISYANQTQTANEKTYLYNNRTIGNNAELFLESEKAAAAHTAAYDFMLSDAISTQAAHVHFDYKHMGAMVRFYMYPPEAPEEGVYIDSLQVVNNDRKFLIEGTMNIDTKALTPTKSSRVMTLKFSPAVDMTNYGSGSDETLDSYQYWRTAASGKIYGYIMAYMMLSPVDLTAEGVDNSTLYLITRQPSYYETKKTYNDAKGTSLDDDDFAALKKWQRMKIYETIDEYNAAVEPDVTPEQWSSMTIEQKMKDYTRKIYSATLSKINFEAGKHYQWNVTNATEDTPITFEEITIQEWAEGTGFTNEDGAGTEDW